VLKFSLTIRSVPLKSALAPLKAKYLKKDGKAENRYPLDLAEILPVDGP
jgi:hypothetical protein